MNDQFTSKDIVSIITACSKHNVRRFKLGELEIDLGESNQKNETVDTAEIPMPQTYDLQGFVEAEQELSEIEADIHKMALLAEDPLAYEQLMEYEAYEKDGNRGAKSVLPRGGQRPDESHGGNQKQYFA